MTVLERKAELVKSILNDINDEQLLTELEMFYKELTSNCPAPCTYSVEELKERTRIAIQQAKEDKVTSQEDMKKRFTA